MSEPAAPEPTPDDDETVTVVRLGPIRHACHSCGSCCTGWSVPLPTLDERKRVIAQAEALAIPEPIVEGNIRREGGRCVFLREDLLCAIHARFGAAEKPSVCQHFPRRTRQAEDGLRIAADPGCSSTWRTFADGPELPSWTAGIARTHPLPPELLASEGALLTLSRQPDMTVPLLIAILTGDHAHLPAPPPAFVARLLERTRQANPYLVDQDNGPLICTTLEPIASFLARFDASAPPPWRPLPPSADAHALDVLQRHLFLRLGDDTVPPMAHTLIVLGGVIACAYVDPRPEVFGPALAAWSRLCRLDKFWVPILPSLSVAELVLNGTPSSPG